MDYVYSSIKYYEMVMKTKIATIDKRSKKRCQEQSTDYVYLIPEYTASLSYDLTLQRHLTPCVME